MAMKFGVEKKGQMFLVVNSTTGDVRGRFKSEGEAQVHRDRLQETHNAGIEQASSRITPPAPIASE